MNPVPKIIINGEKMNSTPQKWFCVDLLRSRKNNNLYIGCTSDLRTRMLCHKDAFEREKRLKHHGSALRNLKMRIMNTLSQGGAG